jgi:hypothetical protein
MEGRWVLGGKREDDFEISNWAASGINGGVDARDFGVWTNLPSVGTGREAIWTVDVSSGCGWTARFC